MSDAIDLVQSGFRGTRYSEDIGSVKLPHPYLELNYKVRQGEVLFFCICYFYYRILKA